MENAILNWIDSLSREEMKEILFQDMWEYMKKSASEDEREEMIYQYGED